MRKGRDAKRGARAVKDGTRYSSVRWRVQVKKLCRQLGEYDYKDVRRELHDWVRGKRAGGVRRSVAMHFPTDPQLRWLLAHATWSEQIEPQRNHEPAKYRYVSDLIGTAAPSNR